MYAIGYITNSNNKITKLVVLNKQTQMAQVYTINEIANLVKSKKITLDNAIYIPSSNTFRGKYDSIYNLLKYEDYGGSKTYALSNESLGKAIAIEKNKQGILLVLGSILSYTGIVKVHMQLAAYKNIRKAKSNYYAVIGERALIIGNGLKCKTVEKNQSSNKNCAECSGVENDPLLNKLNKTVADKNVVWTIQEFEYYMKAKGYTYDLYHNSTKTILCNISPMCDILHIPNGVDEVLDMYNKKPVNDPIIIVSSTVENLLSSKDPDGDVVKRIKSIYFQGYTNSEINPIDEMHRSVNLQWIRNMTITDEAELPEAYIVSHAFCNCEIGKMDCRFDGKIENSFKGVKNSHVTIRTESLYIRASALHMESTDFNVIIVNKNEEDIRLNQSINHCKNCHIGIHNQNEQFELVTDASLSNLDNCTISIAKNITKRITNSLNSLTGTKGSVISEDNTTIDLGVVSNIKGSLFNTGEIIKLAMEKLKQTYIYNIGSQFISIVSKDELDTFNGFLFESLER